MTAVEPRAAALRCAPLRSRTVSAHPVRSALHVPDVTPYHLPRERLSGLLASNPAQLVLLSAPAGSGKTALAAEWARRLDGPRDVVWVGCRGAGDPWARVLQGMGCQGLPDRGRAEEVVETAVRSGRPWTVFLDALEIRS